MIPLLQNKVQVHEHSPSQVQVHEHCPPCQHQPPLYPSISRTQHILVYSLHPHHPSPSHVPERPAQPHPWPPLTPVLSISATAHLYKASFSCRKSSKGFPLSKSQIPERGRLGPQFCAWTRSPLLALCCRCRVPPGPCRIPTRTL